MQYTNSEVSKILPNILRETKVYLLEKRLWVNKKINVIKSILDLTCTTIRPIHLERKTTKGFNEIPCWFIVCVDVYLLHAAACRCSTLLHATPHCSTLPHTADRCSTLLHAQHMGLNAASVTLGRRRQ